MSSYKIFTMRQLFSAKNVHYRRTIAVYTMGILVDKTERRIRFCSAKSEQSVVVEASVRPSVRRSTTQNPINVYIRVASTPSYAPSSATLVALRELCSETSWYFIYGHTYDALLCSN